jgi:hypothetical protein
MNMHDNMRDNCFLMVDCESYALSPRAGLLSIGACFHTNTGAITAFEWRIHGTSNRQYRRELDVETMQWHLALRKNNVTVKKWHSDTWPQRTSIEKALRMLREKTQQYNPSSVWCNHPTADFTWLNTYAEDCNIPLPWSYKDQYDYATIRDIYPQVPMPDVSDLTSHIAKDDAIAQARHLHTIALCTDKRCLYSKLYRG